jgi:hypothetical protein
MRLRIFNEDTGVRNRDCCSFERGHQRQSMTVAYQPVPVRVLAVAKLACAKPFRVDMCALSVRVICMRPAFERAHRGRSLIPKGQSMSFVDIVPEMLSAAADNLQSAGSEVQAQNAAALAPTTGLIPAAADDVSALTAMQFAAHGQMYQAVSAQAAAIHHMFVTVLALSAGSYADTEAANTVMTI